MLHKIAKASKSNDNLPTLNNLLLDDASLELLFKEHFASLCAYCQYKFDLDGDAAREAVHTGFLKLWENRLTLSAELSVKAYLYKIVTNICLDFLRHEKVKQKHVRFIKENAAAAVADPFFRHAELKTLAADIDRAVAELPEQMRKVFELSRYENLKYAEISKQLNISIKTVETQMSRALFRLRKKLAPYLTAVSIAILLAV